MKIRESQDYQDLVIEVKDIRAIEEVFESAFSKETTDAANNPSNDFRVIKVEKSVSFADRFNITVEYDYRSEKSAFLQELTELQVRRCNSIELTFRSTFNGINVSLSMVSGSSYLSKLSLSVSSSDRQFVNGFIKSIDDIVKNMRPQKIAIRKYVAIFDIPIVVLLALGFSYGWLHIIVPKIVSLSIFFLPVSPNAGQIPKDDYILSALARHPNALHFSLQAVNFFLSLVFAYSFFRLIVQELNVMFPKIEFDFGPDHLRQEVRARKRLYVALSFFVIPIIVGLLTNAL